MVARKHSSGTTPEKKWSETDLVPRVTLPQPPKHPEVCFTILSKSQAILPKVAGSHWGCSGVASESLNRGCRSFPPQTLLHSCGAVHVHLSCLPGEVDGGPRSRCSALTSLSVHPLCPFLHGVLTLGHFLAFFPFTTCVAQDFFYIANLSYGSQNK